MTEKWRGALAHGVEHLLEFDPAESIGSLICLEPADFSRLCRGGQDEINRVEASQIQMECLRMGRCQPGARSR